MTYTCNFCQTEKEEKEMVKNSRTRCKECHAALCFHRYIPKKPVTVVQRNERGERINPGRNYLEYFQPAERTKIKKIRHYSGV